MGTGAITGSDYTWNSSCAILGRMRPAAYIMRIASPLGSYFGWNVTAGGFDKGKQCTLSGGYIPFAKTKAERLAAGDPRPSLEERYGNRAAYVAAVRAAAEKAVNERFLLRDDADRLIAQASASDVLAGK